MLRRFFWQKIAQLVFPVRTTFHGDIHPPIRGRQPLLNVPTQTTKKYCTAMCYVPDTQTPRQHRNIAQQCAMYLLLIAQLDNLCCCSLGLCIDFHTQTTKKYCTAMCYVPDTQTTQKYCTAMCYVPVDRIARGMTPLPLDTREK